MTRPYFEVLREEVLDAYNADRSIPLEIFAEEVLLGLCYNRIDGFHAFADMVVATPGLEPHAKIVSMSLTAWYECVQAIHDAARKS